MPGNLNPRKGGTTHSPYINFGTPNAWWYSHYKLAIFAANLVRLISSDVCERVVSYEHCMNV